MRDVIRQRFEQQNGTPGTKSGPSEDQAGTQLRLSAEQQRLLARLDDEHDIATMMSWVNRANRSKFREVVLSPNQTRQ